MQKAIVFEARLFLGPLLRDVGDAHYSLALAKVAWKSTISCVVHVGSYGVIMAIQGSLGLPHPLALHPWRRGIVR
jgi:hypothetical protein